ncbi:DNA starvation/stationary phase protection protein [Jiangella aurantiaca]|uniref:DNA starvation/stationary phase protection protein n=1 Tax=Jiangella aurantiaca TaxID=2530373 RepID=A0A4R5AHA1_9ACTN|nr:DNA starvation/stationary phase protection protein [Jiangella aurantiaca]TDD69442.1 DNA starvation/stationary phase protection protein [Jiangella aurantiaca]
MTTIHSPLTDDAHKVVTEALRDALIDLVDLSLAGKQAHWNVTGPRFRTIHFQLDEVVDAARKHADIVAERSATIGSPPDGRAETVAGDSQLPRQQPGWVRDDDVVATFIGLYDGVIARMRQRAHDVERADPVSNNILLDVIEELEKQYWMWQAERG